VKLSLFALQVFLPLPAADTARYGLVDAIRQTPDACDFATKNASYGRVVQALLPHTQSFVMGVWDYIEDHDRANEEFRSWCDGTENDANEAAPADPYRSGPLHMFATLLFLMAHGKAADRVICEACRMPEEVYWQRATFARLLSSIPHLNFATISSDAIYVRPSGPGGVTAEELAEEHYGYLKKLA
jgi:hypothetical protein